MFEYNENYYEIDENIHEGWVREEDIPDIDRIKDFIEGIKECLYKSGDVAMMESHLDEICHELDIKLNASEPVIEKKGKTDMMNWYLGCQREQLNKVCQ